MTLGGEIKLLDDVAASLRAMASNGVAYDDDVVRWLADQVERAADYAQELADVRAALALLDQKPE
ncbi:MAG TPA: hypothetical protein VGF25_06605 [Thermoleophilaceae bacterium]|jgi:hypothetical protein